jgi:hypothetical protein
MTTHTSRPAGCLSRARRLGLIAASGATVAALLLAGCTSDEDPTATPTATATSDGSVPTATPFPTGTGAPTSPTATSEVSPTTDATPGEGESGEPTAEDAVAVLDRYFSAIGTGDYETAYNLWRNEGEASGQTFEEFVTGFEETASITWEIGEPGRIDPGAGQRYIEIPVRIVARTTGGDSQQFEGTYVLHHTADIEGATPEQRVWHINSAEVEAVE